MDPALFREHVDQLAREERVPTGAFRDHPRQLGVRRSVQQPADERNAVRGGQRSQIEGRHRGPPRDPRRSALQQVGPGRAQEEHWSGDPIQEAIHEVEQGVVGPVNVLDPGDQRVSRRQGREVLRPRVGDHALGGFTSHASEWIRVDRDADRRQERGERGSVSVRLAEAPPDPLTSLGLDDVGWIAVKDRGVVLHHFPKGPQVQPASVG